MNYLFGSPPSLIRLGNRLITSLNSPPHLEAPPAEFAVEGLKSRVLPAVGDEI